MLDRPFVRWLPYAFALLVGLLAIRIGFYADDYALLAFLEKKVPHSPAFWDLYRFGPNDPALTRELTEVGVLPWWTAPGWSLHLFRPLTSLSFAFDHLVFGSWATGYHLHSLAWYLGLIALVAKLHRRWLSERNARLATLLFAVSGAHAMPIGWIAARHLTIAAVFSALGLWLHLSAREDGKRWAALIAPLALFAGLLGSESGIGGICFVLAFELFRTEHWSRRARAAIPALGALGAYLVLHRLAGAGAQNGDGYVHPLRDPLAFAALAAERLPLLIGNALTGAPAELQVLGFGKPLVIAAVAAALLVGFGGMRTWRFVAESERAGGAWLFVGALTTIAVSLGGFPGSRQLLFPNLAISALFAMLIGVGAKRWLAGFLILFHLVLGPLAALGNVLALTNMSRQIETARARSDFSGPTDRPLFVIASDPMIFVYVSAMLLRGQPPGSCWSMLSAAKGTHRLRQTAPDTLELEVVDSTFLRGPFETIYRSSEFPFHPGDSVEQCGARFQVLEVRGGKPSHLQVRFDAPLDSPRIRIIAWQDGALRRVDLGDKDELFIPWTPGPMGTL